MFIIKYHKISSILFCAVLVLGALAAILTPDAEFSAAERRRLAAKPRLSLDTVLSGEYFKKLDSYLTDSFAPREPLRRVKALTELHVFNARDINGIYLTGSGSAVQMEYPLDVNSVEYFTRTVNGVKDKLLTDADRVFYSVIPDKNYYSAEKAGALRMDYDKMLTLLAESLSGIEYIDITDALAESSYYRTDSHWKQECLGGVTAALAASLGYDDPFPQNYETAEFYPFNGVYSGQTALPIAPDTIFYLITDKTKTAAVTHIEDGKSSKVYDTAALSGLDSYDVFLSGATAVCTMKNSDTPEQDARKKLIIFRDSFAGSLAPLLLDMYDVITLIDIRYISPGVLPQFVDFSGSDVLFLYSTGLINKSGVLRQ